MIGDAVKNGKVSQTKISGDWIRVSSCNETGINLHVEQAARLGELWLRRPRTRPKEDKPLKFTLGNYPGKVLILKELFVGGARWVTLESAQYAAAGFTMGWSSPAKTVADGSKMITHTHATLTPQEASRQAKKWVAASRIMARHQAQHLAVLNNGSLPVERQVTPLSVPPLPLSTTWVRLPSALPSLVPA